MDKHTKDLIEILGNELETFNRFLILLDEQHRCLVKGDVDSLNRVNAELEELSNQADRFELKRQSVVREIATNFNLEDNSAKLNGILEKLDSISKNRLQELRQSILDVHAQVERKSQRNKFLIDRSQSLIAESMRIIAGRQSPIYAKDPANSRKSEGVLVDRSA